MQQKILNICKESTEKKQLWFLIELQKTKIFWFPFTDQFIMLLDAAIDFVNENINHFGIVLEKDKIECSFSSKNQQCIKERCPFFRG